MFAGFLQVSIVEGVAVRLQKHRGCPMDAAILHAKASYGDRKESRHDFVLTRQEFSEAASTMEEPQNSLHCADFGFIAHPQI